MLRHVYSAAQLQRYFSHTHFPPHLLPKPGTGSPGMDFLKRLQRYQLATAPWENFSKFYNPIPTPVTSLLGGDELYDKFVGRGASGRLDGRGGRGGGCFENNTFFGNILRSLGYDVYSGAARVSKGHDRWAGWTHMVNFVTIEGKKYLVDVGLGVPGPILPLPLDEHVEHSNIYPASARLVRGHIGPLVSRSDSQRLWIYQHRKNQPPPPSSPSEANRDEWQNTYAFSELEFIPADYESLTVASTFRRNSFFNYTIAAVRMIMAHEVPLISANFQEGSHVRAELGRFVERRSSQANTDADDEIVGVMVLTTTECKCTINGKKFVLKTFEKEVDRLEALRIYFGIEFSESERAGVSESVVSFDRLQF